MRNSAICGPDLDNPEEKRDMGKAEQFRQKRRCKSIRAPTEAEIASLEVIFTALFWNLWREHFSCRGDNLMVYK